MKTVKYWGKWTFSYFRVGNGSKGIGGSLWWNSQRVGLEVSFGVWELQAMREWK